jgi:hypothetical protein
MLQHTHDVQIAQLLEGNASYLHKSTFGIGLLPFTMMAANAIGNSRRKHAAAREAAARLRLVDAGRLHLTNQRLAIQGRMQWMDLWYPDMRMSYCDGNAVTLEMANIPPVRLHTWPAYFVFAMIRFLAMGEVVNLG